MATTTNFGWETPDDTDLVKDGAAAIRTLGSAIDTSLVDMKGGTSGQVLSKNSNTDMDFTWVTPDDADAIQNSIINAKGDLISGSADNTPAILSVGTDTQVLSADSSTATGLKWIDKPTGLAFNLPVGRSLYVRNPNIGTTGSTNAGEDATYYLPIFLPTCTIDRISLRTSSSFSGSATIRLGLYNNSTNGLPSTVVFDAGTVSATAASTNYEITISQSVTAGWYWTALNAQTVSGTISLAATPTASAINSDGLTGLVSATIAGNTIVGYSQTGVTGAFATAGTLGNNTQSPYVWLRIS